MATEQDSGFKHRAIKINPSLLSLFSLLFSSLLFRLTHRGHDRHLVLRGGLRRKIDAVVAVDEGRVLEGRLADHVVEAVPHLAPAPSAGVRERELDRSSAAEEEIEDGVLSSVLLLREERGNGVELARSKRREKGENISSKQRRRGGVKRRRRKVALGTSSGRDGPGREMDT